MAESFEQMLTGGHPNSLGRTVEVVETIQADPDRIEELYGCYFSDDEVVRLRTSNAFKRLWRDDPTQVAPFIPRFIEEISKIEQYSAQWTVAQLFLELDSYLSDAQRATATEIVKGYLENVDDWIVLNNCIETLATWAKSDDGLRAWLRPHLERLAADSRKSVAKRAAKALKGL